MPSFAYGPGVTARQISEVALRAVPAQRPPGGERAREHPGDLNQNLDVSVSTGFVSSSQRLPQTDNNTTGLLSNGFGGPGNKDNGRYGYRVVHARPVLLGAVAAGHQTASSQPHDQLASSLMARRPSDGRRWIYTGREDSDLCRRDQCTTFAGSLGPFKTLDTAGQPHEVSSATRWGQCGGDIRLTPTLRGKTTVGLQFFQNRSPQCAFGANELPPGATTVSAGSVLQADEATTIAKTLGPSSKEQFTSGSACT